MSENWFYEVGGERQGPVTEDALRDLKKAASVDDTNLVWKEGMDVWQPYGQSVLANAPGSPPPVPKGNAIEGQPPAIREKLPFIAREARLRSDSSVGIRSTLGRAWTLLCSDFWRLIGYCTLMTILLSIAMQLGVTVFFLMFPMMAGGYYYVLKRTRNQEGTLDDLFDGFRRRFGDLAIANLILCLPLIAVMILPFLGIFVFGALAIEINGDSTKGIILFAVLIVVSIFLQIIIGLMSSFSGLVILLIIDCDITWKEAMRLAWIGTKKHMSKLILFGITTIFLSYAGMIALYVGAFVTCAWVMIATAYLYEDIFGDDPKRTLDE